MGMSLKVEAFYGWPIGHQDKFENVDHEFDYDEWNEGYLNHLEIDCAYYYDYRIYFLKLKKVATVYDWDGGIIRVGSLPRVKLSPNEVGEIKNELAKVESLFEIKLEEQPDWYVATEYF